MSLRLLLDENSESKRFQNVLLKAGHDVVCLKELLPKGTLDVQVLSLGARENRIVYTQDRDFLKLAQQVQVHKGIILEFLTGTPGDMSFLEVVKALATIEKNYSSLENQLIIINSFRPR